VVVNATNEITFELKAVVGPVVTPAGPSHTKRTVGFIMLGVAGAAAVGAGTTTPLYFSNSGTWNSYASQVDAANTQICTANQGPPSAGGVTPADACSARRTATGLS